MIAKNTGIIKKPESHWVLSWSHFSSQSGTRSLKEYTLMELLVVSCINKSHGVQKPLPQHDDGFFSAWALGAREWSETCD